jgi:hypothetical protein
MNETVKATAQSAADDKVYVRLEKDLTAVKNDVAHLSQQISESLNAIGAVAHRRARRGLRNARANVASLMTGGSDRAGAVANTAHHAASSVGDTLAGVIQEPPVATRGFGFGTGSRSTADWERSAEMEFLLMKLEAESVKADSIFAVLDNEKRGQLPPPPEGHWSEYSTVAERDFRFAAAAKLAITKSGYFLVGSDAIEGWGLPRPGALGRKFRPSC